MRRALLLSSLALISCGSRGGAGAPDGATVAMAITAPAGILSSADSLTLWVAPLGNLACDAATGKTSRPLSGEASMQRFDMSKTGCPSGALWCADVSLPLDPSAQLMFAVEADQGGSASGYGCASGAVASDPFDLAITIQKVTVAGTCGNSVVEPGEDCDEGKSGNFACDAKCLALELPLSTNDAGLAPGTKHHVSTIWQPETSAPLNPLRAVFQNDATAGSPPFREIDLRERSATLDAVTSPASLANELALPTQGGGTRALDQTLPSIGALSDGSFAVAFLDSRNNGPSVTVTGFAASTQPGVDGLRASNSLQHCDTPDVAGGPAAGTSARALVVWTDTTQHQIFGRLYDRASDALVGSGPFTISAAGAAADSPHVAGAQTGFRVVWHGQGANDADDVLSASVDVNGTVGTPAPVSTATTGVQDQPDVAMLSDGTWAVVFRDDSAGSTVLRLQRFDKNGVAVAGDQANAVNDAGAAAMPAIAAGGGASNGAGGTVGFFAIAWEDGAGNIGARFAGASAGFLYAVSTGKNTSFTASKPGVAGQRHAPSIAVGGKQPTGNNGYVAVSWSDDGAANGVWTRRLPLPTTQ